MMPHWAERRAEEICRAVTAEHFDPERLRMILTAEFRRLAARQEEFEREANENYAEACLYRNEAARLRENLAVVSSFVESLDVDIPEEVQVAIDTIYPPPAGRGF
jgi:hypothetical protein